jgi:hypothetical protein
MDAADFTMPLPATPFFASKNNPLVHVGTRFPLASNSASMFLEEFEPSHDIQQRGVRRDRTPPARLS